MHNFNSAIISTSALVILHTGHDFLQSLAEEMRRKAATGVAQNIANVAVLLSVLCIVLARCVFARPLVLHLWCKSSLKCWPRSLLSPPAAVTVGPGKPGCAAAVSAMPACVSRAGHSLRICQLSSALAQHQQTASKFGLHAKIRLLSKSEKILPKISRPPAAPILTHPPSHLPALPPARPLAIQGTTPGRRCWRH